MTTLLEVQAIAKQAGYYVIALTDAKGPFHVLYKNNGTRRGVRVGSRRSIEAMNSLVKKACKNP